MVIYDIAALLARFDVRVETETALTGKLSNFLGESLLLSALSRYLTVNRGHQVQVLGGRPHRDNSELAGRGGAPRDLDAWLLLDGEHLAAVECKHWTSSSVNYSTVPGTSEALADHAKAEWQWLVSEHFAPLLWTDVNKVALPLQPPRMLPSSSTAEARRILAVWTPVSEDGHSCLSRAATTTVRQGKLVSIEVEVFSASIYLRGLLATGMTHLSAESEDTEEMLAALGALVEAQDPGGKDRCPAQP